MKRLFFILLFLIAIPLYPADYYVKTGGNDGADGLSDGNAWATIGKVVDEMATFNAGDTINFNRGDTFSDARLNIKCNGSDPDYITFQAYGTGNRPIIDVEAGCIYVGPTAGVDWIKIKDLELTGSTETSVVLVGYSGDWCNDIYFEDLYIHDGAGWGILAKCTDTITVDNCEVHDCGTGGIKFTGSAANAITNGWIKDCTVYNIDNEDGIAIHRDASSNGTGPNHVIEDCLVYDIVGGENCLDIADDDAQYFLLRNNTCYSSSSYTVTVGYTADYVYFDDNYFYSGAGIFRLSDTTHCVMTRNRLAYSTIYAAFEGIAQNEATSIWVANNTVYMDSDIDRALVRAYTNATALHFRNNAFYYTGETENDFTEWVSGTPAGTGADFDYNMYYRSDNDAGQSLWYNKTFANWQSEESQDANGSFDDPELNAPPGCEPLASSPVIDAGGWLTTITTANGSGTSFVVDDPVWFHDGFGITTGSEIQLEGDSTSVTVTDVNYGTSTITVDESVAWTQGDGVAFEFNDSAPDIGSEESSGGGESPEHKTVLKSGVKAVLKPGVKWVIKEPLAYFPIKQIYNLSMN